MSAASTAMRSDGPVWALRDVGVLTLRNLRHFARQPQLLLLATVQPVIFVLLFVYVFGGAIGTTLPAGVDYVDHLLPGVFVQTVMLGATQTAVGLASDLELGVVDRIRSMPATQGAVLAGRTFADLVRNLWSIAVMIAVGYALGFRFTEGVLAALATVAVVLALGFAVSWIFAFLAMVVDGAESAQARSRCSPWSSRPRSSCRSTPSPAGSRASRPPVRLPTRPTPLGRWPSGGGLDDAAHDHRSLGPRPAGALRAARHLALSRTRVSVGVRSEPEPRTRSGHTEAVRHNASNVRNRLLADCVRRANVKRKPKSSCWSLNR